MWSLIHHSFITVGATLLEKRRTSMVYVFCCLMSIQVALICIFGVMDLGLAMVIWLPP